ncbi:MAG: hypothetical protein ACKVJC_10890 [Flavobacteriales bacterium]|nr:hypothetical protein [Crocinitomicaceae bacterium]|tara:strand:- start:257 stop:682 length:426 start_codon:yes stop_codon:yes gene_type:complete
MKIHFILLIFVGLLVSGCKKNSQNPVPSIQFDIAINITLPSYSALIGVSGWAYVNGGSKGIIVYRRGVDEFIAFDRHSPADEDGSCATPLYPGANNFLELLDDCNSALFSLYDGSPISGSQYGLRQYQTSWNGNETLRIFN